METSSAHRPTPRSAPPRTPVGWILAGLGVVLVAAALYIQFAGPIAWSGTLQPVEQKDTISSYVTPEILLEPGTYGIHVGYRQPPRMVEIHFGQYSARVSSPEEPGWEAVGHLKKQKRKKTSGFRPRVSGDIVAHVPTRQAAPLRLEVEGAGDAHLSVTIRRTRMDHRVPLYVGIALLALGLLLEPSIREGLQRLTGG